MNNLNTLNNLNNLPLSNFDKDLKFLITENGGVKNIQAFFNRLGKLITGLEWMTNEKTMLQIKDQINNITSNLNGMTSSKKINVIITKIHKMQKICEKVIGNDSALQQGYRMKNLLYTNQT